LHVPISGRFPTWTRASFGPAMPESATIDQALDLAEQIFDQVTRSEQDWRSIERLAGALAKLAAAAASEARG
jgi:hypothetical protein